MHSKWHAKKPSAWWSPGPWGDLPGHTTCVFSGDGHRQGGLQPHSLWISNPNRILSTAACMNEVLMASNEMLLGAVLVSVILTSRNEGSGPLRMKAGWDSTASGLPGTWHWAQWEFRVPQLAWDTPNGAEEVTRARLAWDEPLGSEVRCR